MAAVKRERSLKNNHLTHLRLSNSKTEDKISHVFKSKECEILKRSQETIISFEKARLEQSGVLQ